MDIYDRIKARRLELGMTQAELADKAGYKGKDMISRIESKKVTLTHPRIVAFASALDVSEGWLMGWAEKASSYKTAMIPLLSSVSCGSGILAEENINGYVDIPESMASTGEFFGLTIKGDSMEPDLHDKDVVIVKQQPDAETGDLVIAKVNGDEGFCKRLKKYADGIALVSVNPSYEPMYFSEKQVKEEPVVVVGKVVEVRRKL